MRIVAPATNRAMLDHLNATGIHVHRRVIMVCGRREYRWLHVFRDSAKCRTNECLRVVACAA